MDYCRLCLTDLVSLEDFNIQSIHEKIKTVFSFEITSHPDLPEVICPACAKTISQFYDYFCLVHQNQLRLYCQIEENLVKTECSEAGKLQSVESQEAVDKEIQIESHEPGFDTRNEAMEDDDSTPDIPLKNGDEWLPEDEIKIEPTEIIADDSVTRQTWKMESNCLFRKLDMVCDICQKDMFTYESLEKHVHEAHAKQCWIACCEQWFTSEQIPCHFDEHIPVVELEGSSNEKRDEPHRPLHDLEFDMDQTNEGTNSSSGSTNNLRRNSSEDHPWKLEINIISRNLDMKCEICHVDQSTYQKLESHLKECHSRQCYITCCGLKLDGDQSLVNHFENHFPNVTSKKICSRYEYNKAHIFGTILTDFASVLKGYEPLPNMKLALKNDTTEKKKLDKVVDFLVQTYFPSDCQLCGKKCETKAARRRHFKKSHPKEKMYDSCCGIRFTERIGKMRHLNNHWKPLINPVRSVSTYKKPRLSDIERTTMIMENFRGELEEVGFEPPVSWKSSTNDDSNYLRKMEDYLIAKYLTLNCELCDANLSSCTERRDHLRNLHSLRRYYLECCNMKIYKRMQIFRHLLYHKNGLHLVSKYGDVHDIEALQVSNIESFFNMDCTFCDFKGSSYVKLRAHIYNHHRNEKFSLTCCNIRLYKKYQLLAHIASHRTPFVKCEHCEEKFSDVKELKVHTRSMHASERIFKCDQCDERFSDPKMLLDHQYKHKQGNCDICGVEINKDSIPRHKLSVHKLGEEIQCPDCPKVFYHTTNYMAHRKRKHLKPKLSVKKEVIDYNVCCPLCSKRFTTMKGLKLHHRRSHAVKGYKKKSLEINLDALSKTSVLTQM